MLFVVSIISSLQNFITNHLVHPSSQHFNTRSPGRMVMMDEDVLPPYCTKPQLIFHLAPIPSNRAKIIAYPHWILPTSPTNSLLDAFYIGMYPGAIYNCRPAHGVPKDEELQSAQTFVRQTAITIINFIRQALEESDKKNPRLLQYVGTLSNLCGLPSRGPNYVQQLKALVYGWMEDQISTEDYDRALHCIKVIADFSMKHVQMCIYLTDELQWLNYELDMDQPSGMTISTYRHHFLRPSRDIDNEFFPLPTAATLEDKPDQLNICSLLCHRRLLDPCTDEQQSNLTRHFEPMIPAPDLFFSTVNHPLNILTPCTWTPVIPSPSCPLFLTPYHQFQRDGKVFHIRSGSIIKLEPDVEGAENEDHWVVISTWIKLSSTRMTKECDELKRQMEDHNADAGVRQGAENTMEKLSKFQSRYKYSPNTMPKCPSGLVTIINVKGRTMFQIRQEIESKASKDCNIRTVIVEQIASVEQWPIDKFEGDDKVRIKTRASRINIMNAP